MPKTPVNECLCCRRSLPVLTQFRSVGGHLLSICIHCEMLSPEQLVIKTREETDLRWRIKYQTKEGRKALRVERRQEAYATAGKRCSSCHHYKPVTEYHACGPQPDGLQSACICCNKTRALLIQQPGGRQSWITYRDAMRASAPPKK